MPTQLRFPNDLPDRSGMQLPNPIPRQVIPRPDARQRLGRRPAHSQPEPDDLRIPPPPIPMLLDQLAQQLVDLFQPERHIPLDIVDQLELRVILAAIGRTVPIHRQRGNPLPRLHNSMWQSLTPHTDIPAAPIARLSSARPATGCVHAATIGGSRLMGADVPAAGGGPSEPANIRIQEWGPLAALLVSRGGLLDSTSRTANSDQHE
jgi:hypothetical protein